MVKLMLDKGITNPRECVDYACENKNIEIAKLIISKNQKAINKIFPVLCRYGNCDLLEFCISLDIQKKIDYPCGFITVCNFKRKDARDLLLKKSTYDWNYLLQCGCQFDYDELARFAVKNGGMCIGCDGQCVYAEECGIQKEYTKKYYSDMVVLQHADDM
jgi:hypothetical protein